MSAVGFDVDARSGGKTALHDAAFSGDVALIAALLAAGADRETVDHEYAATPLGWAEYACQPAAIEALRPLSER
jgi:ankyrin repeat protein